MPNTATKHDYGSLSTRLSFLMSEGGVKHSHLANKLGVTPAAIHYLCNADVKSSRHTKKIAEVLNVNEEWLATGKGNIYLEKETSLHQIPVYYMDALLLSLRHKAKVPDVQDFYYTAQIYNKGAFGVYISDEDLSPKFELSDIVVFEPDVLREGILALIYVADMHKLMIRQLYKSGDDHKYMLLAGHNKPLSIDLKGQDKVLGVYRECRKIARD